MKANILKRSFWRKDTPPGFLYVDEWFETREQWLDYANANPSVIDAASNDRIGERVLRDGFKDPATGARVAPNAIAPGTGNWREELFAEGLNARMRGSLMVLLQHLDPNDQMVRIFATEAVTPFALVLRGKFPRFLGSEYAKDDATRRDLYPIRHQDLMALDLPSEAFDIVTTNEVLEHVPDLDVALREIARVLAPGGWHVGTHPFRYMDEEGDVRSRLVDGQVVHLKEPEIHGNPVDPGGGSLVFETPGWNILARAREAGFSRAFMRFFASEEHGVVTQTGGVFVLVARK